MGLDSEAGGAVRFAYSLLTEGGDRRVQSRGHRKDGGEEKAGEAEIAIPDAIHLSQEADAVEHQDSCRPLQRIVALDGQNSIFCLKHGEDRSPDTANMSGAEVVHDEQIFWRLETSPLDSGKSAEIGSRAPYSPQPFGSEERLGRTTPSESRELGVLARGKAMTLPMPMESRGRGYRAASPEVESRRGAFPEQCVLVPWDRCAAHERETEERDREEASGYGGTILQANSIDGLPNYEEDDGPGERCCGRDKEATSANFDAGIRRMMDNITKLASSFSPHPRIRQQLFCLHFWSSRSALDGVDVTRFLTKVVTSGEDLVIRRTMTAMATATVTRERTRKRTPTRASAHPQAHFSL
ncbi:hypothetical protein C8R45DRAFT_948128 [Mycena sanguinolenta]|nr:hypothetical protein C8R45DRAFT_948128 [Mycena sanguinolenta]